MTRTTYALLTLLFIITTAFFSWRWMQIKGELAQAQTQIQQANLNTNVLTFTQLFIDKILKAQGEVDFETRLELENDVRNLKNPAILAAWQRFTTSKTEAEAQAEVKNLLELLIKSIKPQAA